MPRIHTQKVEEHRTLARDQRADTSVLLVAFGEQGGGGGVVSGEGG